MPESPNEDRAEGVGPASQGAPDRVVLAGTPAAVEELYRSLPALRPVPRVLGAVLTREGNLPCPVLGDTSALQAVAADRRPDAVLIALPTAMRGLVRGWAAALDAVGVPWRVTTPLSDQLAGRTAAGTGEIDLAALIDRHPYPLDHARLNRLIAGKTVLITGAGGSIGSELSRIVAGFAPRRLVLVERSENALFEIDRALRRQHPGLSVDAVLHDVTLRERTFDVVDRFSPDVVLHAAAHKHVPMMEGHPAEAVENNFYGTRSIADASDRCGVEEFVMISTDKAVNPSSVMGGSKRLAELYIRGLNQQSSTTYCMVRFGNVLGSACSVLPIWTDQLRGGGPITVTHEAMTRYFMTIPEAAGLVLEAAALSGTLDAQTGEQPGGEVFLLDMGRPIRVLEMAERFLRNQGVEPGRDVDIQITGPRPGEKLFEELAYSGEDMIPTAHPAVRVWRTTPPDQAHMRGVIDTFDRLREASGDATQPWRGVKREAVVNALRSLLPEMVLAAA